MSAETGPPSGVDPKAETRILPDGGVASPPETWSVAPRSDPLAETAPPPRAGGSGVGPILPEAIGRYAVSAELGRGGMGIVYRGRDRELKRDVAIKLVLDPTRVGEDELRRFRREASAAARLKHPGIVAVHEVGEDEGRPFLVLELVEGRNLEELLRAEQVDHRRAAELVRGVAEALAHAHAQGVVHRDVKPENVLVDASGRPRLTDFGLARDVVASAALTVSGQVMGTPAYMAPEQARGDARAHGPGTDVYALGGLLYRALAGRPPFAAPSLEALLAQVLTAEPCPPRRLDPAIPIDLETIALRCLEKEPARRYGTAGEVAEELGRWLEARPIVARPVGRAGRALRWARRDPLRAGLVGLVLLLLLTGGFSAAVLPDLLAARAEAQLLRQARADAAEGRQALARVRELPAAPGPGRERDRALHALVSALDAWDRLQRLDQAARPQAAAVALEAAELAARLEDYDLCATALVRAQALGADPQQVQAASLRLSARRGPPAQPPAPEAEPAPAPAAAPPPDTSPPSNPGQELPAPAMGAATPASTEPDPSAVGPTEPPPEPEPPPEAPTAPPGEQPAPLLAEPGPPPEEAPAQSPLEAATTLGNTLLEGLRGADAEQVEALIARLRGDPAAELGPYLLEQWEKRGRATPPRVMVGLAQALGPLLARARVAAAQAIAAKHLPSDGRTLGGVTLTLEGSWRAEIAVVGLRTKDGAFLLLRLESDWPRDHARRAMEVLRELLGTTGRASAFPARAALEERDLCLLEYGARQLKLPGYAVELRTLPGEEYGLVAAPTLQPADPTWICGPLPGEHDPRKSPYVVRERKRKD